MSRIKQLDSLRAIAVLLVIVHHSPIGMHSPFLNYYPMGANMFMVLSGYLITSILLHEKGKALLLGTSRLTVYRNFAAKRALRIFPLYFLTLLAISLRGDFKPYFMLSLATFTTNFYVFLKQDWVHLSHIWSLSVQEHFYAFWPLVMLFTPKKRLLPMILFFILLGIVCQKMLARNEFGIIITPSCFDALGAGALLAWMFANKELDFAKAYRWLSIAALASLLVFSFSYAFDKRLVLPFRTLYAVMVMWLIAYIVHKGENGVLNKRYLLNNPVLHFIGKISFGLYLLHPVIPDFTHRLLDFVNARLPGVVKPYVVAIYRTENYLLVLLCSWLSYRFIELPFLKMKKYFVIDKAAQSREREVELASVVPAVVVVESGEQKAGAV